MKIKKKLNTLWRRLCTKILPLCEGFPQPQQTACSPFTFAPVRVSFHSYFTLWPLLSYHIHLGMLSSFYKKPTCFSIMQKSERKIMWVRSQAVFHLRTWSILCFIHKVLLSEAGCTCFLICNPLWCIPYVELLSNPGINHLAPEFYI